MIEATIREEPIRDLTPSFSGIFPPPKKSELSAGVTRTICDHMTGNSPMVFFLASNEGAGTPLASFPGDVQQTADADLPGVIFQMDRPLPLHYSIPAAVPEQDRRIQANVP